MAEDKNPTARELSIRARIAGGLDPVQAEACEKRQEESDAAEAAAATKAKPKTPAK